MDRDGADGTHPLQGAPGAEPVRQPACMVRAGERSDLPALRRIIDHYIRESAANFKTLPLDDGEADEWFDQFSHPSGRYHLVVAESLDAPGDGPGPVSSTLAGFAASVRFHPRAAYETSVMTSVYLDPDACARGIGSRLYARLFERLAAADIHRAYAGITLPNDASIALHRKFGFADAGVFTEAGRKFGRYWDVVWMEKRF